MKNIPTHFAGLFILFVSVFLTACGSSSSSGSEDSGTPGTYYVDSAAANDLGDGLSPATAKRTIMAAINAAANPSEVRVNEGNFTVDSSPGSNTNILLKEGVSLFGGYNADFTMRDSQVYTSVITDTGSGASENSVIRDSILVTTATIVDGFTINASTTMGVTTSYGIYMKYGSPTIRDCIIDGGSGSTLSAGIRSHLGSPVIEYNTISGGSSATESNGILSYINNDPVIRFNTIGGGVAPLTIGIFNYLSIVPRIYNNQVNGGSATQDSIGIANSGLSLLAPVIYNNLVDGGSAVQDSIGIENRGSSLTLYNNSIYGGSAGNVAVGLKNSLGRTSTITNNIINGGSATNHTHGILNNGASTSITVRNNTVYAGTAGMTTNGISNTLSEVTSENNIFFADSGAEAFGIAESNTSSNIDIVNNNSFFGFTVIYFDFSGGCLGNGDADDNASTCTLAEMEALADITSAGNVSADPLFMDIDGMDNDISTMDDNDWHFSAMSPASVTAGGLNGLDEMPAWGFTDDRDGVTRPATGNPWSMGAYEP